MKRVNKKNMVLIFAIASFVLTSCTDGIFGIKGDGPIVTQELTFNELEGVNMMIAGNVHLTQSDEQVITISAQQNIIDNLKTSVSGGVVDFDFDRNVKSHDGVDIYMSISNLSLVSLSGSGDINTTDTFNIDGNLRLVLSGSGNFNIEANANEVYSNISGSGDFTINTVTEYLECGISGSGKYTLSGLATEADYSISGSGNFEALELATKKTSIDISGSGDLRVNVSDELNIKISGSGDIYYIGNPRINTDISGSGNIHNSN